MPKLPEFSLSKIQHCKILKGSPEPNGKRSCASSEENSEVANKHLVSVENCPVLSHLSLGTACWALGHSAETTEPWITHRTHRKHWPGNPNHCLWIRAPTRSHNSILGMWKELSAWSPAVLFIATRQQVSFFIWFPQNQVFQQIFTMLN